MVCWGWRPDCTVQQDKIEKVSVFFFSLSAQIYVIPSFPGHLFHSCHVPLFTSKRLTIFMLFFLLLLLLVVLFSYFFYLSNEAALPVLLNAVNLRTQIERKEKKMSRAKKLRLYFDLLIYNNNTHNKTAFRYYPGAR